VQWAAQQAGINLNSLYIIAPWFLTNGENVTFGANTPMFWDFTSSWVDCGKSSTTQAGRTASCQVLDELIALLATGTSVSEILIVGNSAGGQFVQQYALFSPSAFAANVSFFAMNAPTYCYLDGNRTMSIAYANASACTGFCDATAIPTASYSFGVPVGAQSCSGLYNVWPYGALNRSEDSYTTPKGAVPVGNFKARDVTYLVGTGDVCSNITSNCGCNDMTFDGSCSAQLQGNCRFQRGWVFYNYLQFFYQSPTHSIASVQGVGHDGCNMLLSSTAQSAIFAGLIPPASTTGATSGSPAATTGSAPAGSTTSSATTAAVSVVLALSAVLVVLF